jgi:tRNA A-37 threonylcarbamoyl transferase component Bud32
MASPAFELTKRNARTTAGFLTRGDHRAFVKRIASRNLVHGWIARGFGSRATRAARGARILSAGGFRHPELRLIFEARRRGAICTSFIVTEALDRARILSQLALPRARDIQLRRMLARRAALEIRRLHDAGLYTLDLQETNLMVEETDGAHTFYFVDLEDFRRVRRVSERRRMTNLVHLDRSIGRFASRAKRLRFLYDYWGKPASREAAHILVNRYLAVRGSVERRSRASRNSGVGAR